MKDSEVNINTEHKELPLSAMYGSHVLFFLFFKLFRFCLQVSYSSN